MLWEDLEPGDKLMFNPEWVKKCSKEYYWWIGREYKNKTFTIKSIDMDLDKYGFIDFYFLEIETGFGISKETGLFCNKRSGLEPPLFKIVELKDD